MAEHDVEIALLKKEVELLNGKLDQVSADVRGLTDAWKAAGTLTAFIKTAAAVVVAVSLIFGTLKLGISGGKP